MIQEMQEIEGKPFLGSDVLSPSSIAQIPPISPSPFLHSSLRLPLLCVLCASVVQIFCS